MKISEEIYYEQLKNVSPEITLLGKPAVAHGERPASFFGRTGFRMSEF